MKTQKFIEYSVSQPSSATIVDPYWNDVKLLMGLDYRDSQGLPWYRDYSSHIRKINKITGTNNGDASTALKVVTTTDPEYLADSLTDIQAYTYFNNKVNHAHILANVNGNVNTFVYPDQLIVEYDYNPSLKLGNSDFTIEASFYVEQVNLPWKIQTIVSQASFLDKTDALNEHPTSANIATLFALGAGSVLEDYRGWGLFVSDDDIYFEANTSTYLLYQNITPNTWYHIAVQRRGTTLTAYLQGNKVATFTGYNITFNQEWLLDPSSKFNRLLGIGAAAVTSTSRQGTSDIQDLRYRGFTSLSGGIANVRITSAARYTQDIYTLQLPFPNYATTNPVDANYNNIAYYLPATYDYFDYGPQGAHITNNNLLLSSAPNFNTGYLHLNGTDKYQTKPLNTTLGNNWTIEFETCLFFNGEPVDFFNTSSIRSSAVFQLLVTFNTAINSRTPGLSNGVILETRFPILNLTNSTGDKYIKIEAVAFKVNSSFGNSGSQNLFYFAVKLSSDGINWLELPSNINRTISTNPLTYLRNEDVVLAASYSANYGANLPTSDNAAIRSASCSVGYHVAVQQGNNELKLFVNGSLIQTIPFAHTLHNILGSDLILELGGYHDPRTIGMFNSLNTSNNLIGLGTLGIRNLKISKYGVYTDTFTNFELYFRQVNAYPLKTAANKPVPARGRIIDLITETNQFTSLDEVSWLVYTNIYLSNLDLTDFSLTQLGGIVDAELIDFSQVSPYVYRVTASTGTGNGTLTLNFIDNNTVRRSIDNSVIGMYLGELSLMGESYTIKKNNPLPVLYSGSNPYVKEDFFVYVQFDANVAIFDTSKIGIQNAIITRSDIIDELTGLYRLTIRPTKEGAISIQALSGTGVTTNGLLSVPSEVFTRVYSESFVILQLPLDIANNRNDLSPARISLNQVTQGNESYSAEAPTGATSSLSIVPASETSGFTYNFNSVAGLSYLSDSGDWTIEWFSRTNTPLSTNFTHLFTLDNGNLGFSIYASNRRIFFARNYTQKASILTSFVWQEYEGNAFVPWSNTAFTPLHKYPHFAITKEGDVYRFYRNGTRINLIQSSTNVDIRQGTLNVGYYKNYVTDVPGLVSNIRLTYGKALYTSQFVNVPQIPYAVPINITDEAELVNNITAFSDNDVATLATIGNKIFVRFNTIAPVLLSELSLTINGETAQVTTEGNGYIGSILVSPTSQQGFIDIVLTIDSSYAPLKIFTATTDGSNVFIDYEITDITITSNTPNTDDYIIDIEFIFNKPIDNFTAADVTVVNGTLVNLQATDYNTRYTGVFLATATGSISLYIDADTIQDRAGNLNNSSNVFTRTVVKPAYTPDPYYNNVVALIQDDVNIVESISNFAIDTNCALSNTTAPVGLNKSIYFDGVTSYLSFDTGYTIASSRMYTLELWCYVSNSAILRLDSPNIYNASEITSTSFKASWQKVENATAYALDVAYDNNFNSKVPGYDAALVGDIDNITVSGDYDSVVPVVTYPRYLDSSSILFEWSYSPPINDTNLGYAVQCAIDPGFSNILYQFNNTSTNKPNMLIGDAVKLKRSVAPVDSGDVGGTINLVDNSKGVILTGLYSTDSFPALMYFKGESSIRWYKDNNYQVPAIADDIDALSWKHVAIVNNGRYTYLYVDGHLEDKSTTTTLPGQVNLGYNIGHFEGYITGFRLTKDVARYTGDTYTVPTLPYSTN